MGIVRVDPSEMAQLKDDGGCDAKRDRLYIRAMRAVSISPPNSRAFTAFHKLVISFVPPNAMLNL